MNIFSSSPIKRQGNFWPGTLGGFFQFAGTAGVYGISNNHVLANLNQCHTGDVIEDAGSQSVIGSLDSWQPLDLAAINYIDTAFFLLDPQVCAFWNLPNGAAAPAADFSSAVPGSYVYRMSGAGPVWGKLTNVQASFVFTQQGDNYTFEQLLQIEPYKTDVFSSPGDSGSLILDQNNAILGLLMGAPADNPAISFACPFLNGGYGIGGPYGLFKGLSIYLGSDQNYA